MALADLAPDDRSLQLLRRSLERGRLGHAYLLSGPRLGVLEQVARNLAKAVMCNQGESSADAGVGVEACGSCANCRRIEDDTHPDVHWVRPASKLRVILIDQIRELMRVVHLKPCEGRWKTAIISAADRMNPQAANAFLKTLEEPPQRSILLLLSSEPQRLLDTIRSRCLPVSFGETAMPELDPSRQAWLSEFLAAATAAGTGLIGRYRLLGRLLAQLDQIRSAAQQGLETSDLGRRVAEFDPDQRERAESELKAALEAEYRQQRSGLMSIVHWWLRDVWLCAQGIGPGLYAFPDCRDATEVIARRITADDARQNLELIDRTQRMLDSNLQETLVLEVWILQLRL